MSKVAKKSSGEVKVRQPQTPPVSFEEMDRWFEHIFPRGWLRPFRWDWPGGEFSLPMEATVPKVDVIDRNEEIVVRAQVPGVNKEDLNITVTENTVTLKGQSRFEAKEEKGDYYRSEITQGAFARTIHLPVDVDTEHVKTRFGDGILELVFPKLTKSKRRTIEIH